MLTNKLLLLVSSVLLLSGCAFSENYQQSQRMFWEPSYSNEQIRVYGGVRSNVYLGILDPNKSADSILNKSGKYGNKTSELSIANKSGLYGSLSSPLSACNKTATYPPILKDKYGYNLGTFTLNPNAKLPVSEVFLKLLRNICQ